MVKCVCHINGFELKDGKARQAIEEINEKLISEERVSELVSEALNELPTPSEGVTEERVSEMISEAINNALGGEY